MKTTAEVRRERHSGCSRHRRPRREGWGTYLASRQAHVGPRSTPVGTVLLARVDFAEGTDFKVRPVVVVGVERRRVLVQPCTTSTSGRLAARLITDLAVAGLWRPTSVRPETISLEPSQVLTVLGRLSMDDHRALALGDSFSCEGATLPRHDEIMEAA